MTNSVSKKEMVLQRTKAFAALLCLLFFFLMKAEGQTIYDWLNTAPDGNWRQGAAAARWNPGGLFNEPPNATGAILRFNNNTFTTMTNNAGSNPYSIHQIIFGSGANVSRSISGTSVQFFEFGATWPLITNQSSVIHSISFPIIASSNNTYNLELIANAGPLIFSGTINNNGRNLMIYGNNSVLDGTNRFIRLSGDVSGGGGLTISQLGVVRLNAAHSYTGSTQIDNGELWIESSGTINSSAVAVGNAGQQANTAKIWIETATGGTTFSNNLTINQGNTGTREIGGLNTSGTNTFSGNITNNSSNGLNLRSLNTGALTNFTGVISQANPIIIVGAGIVQVSGNNTYTGSTTIQSGATLRLGAAGSGANSPLGTTGAGTTVNSGGVLDLNGFTLTTTEALTLNGTGISNGGALINSSASAATYTGTIALASASSINTTGNITASGVISGANALTKIGNGTFILAAANTYSGGTTINAGTVQLNNTGGLGTGGITMGGGTLSLNGNSVSIASLSGTSGTVQNANATPATLTVNTSSNTSYSGNINDGTGGGALTFIKSGTGTLTLSGNNTFTGNTTINAGTLAYDNINALRTSSNLIVNASTVNIGANFSGAKTAGDLTVTGASAISFSSSANAVDLTFANFTASGASTITITGWSPVNNKRIFVTNTASLPSGDLSKINFAGYGIGAKFNGNELVPALFYVTQTTGSGNFNVSANWINGGPAGTGGEYIYVQPGFTLNMNASYTVSGATVAGTLNLGTSNLNIQTGGTLVNISGAIYSGTGAVNFQGTATISGTATVSNIIVNGGAVDFGTGTTIGAGYSLSFSNTGGSVNTNAPRYASGSTLIYNSGGTFSRGLEWSAPNGSTIGSTQGFPSNVVVTNGTTLNMNNAGANLAMQGNLTLGSSSGTGSLTLAGMGSNDLYIGGNLNIGSASIAGTLTMSTSAGGDIFISGNWTRASNGSFNDNNRAVNFIASSSDQTITGPGLSAEIFSYIIVNTSNGYNVKLNSDITLDGGIGGYILELWSGALDMNGKTLNYLIENGGVNNLGIRNTGTRQIINSDPVNTAFFKFYTTTGPQQIATVTQLSGSALLSFDNRVTIILSGNSPNKAGVNFGANLTTVYGTLRIDLGGFVQTNPPKYDPASSLIYNTTGNYDRAVEWNNNTSTAAGYPGKIIVTNATNLNLNTNAPGTDIGCASDFTIESGATVSSGTLVNDLYIGGNLFINGTYQMSSQTGADLYLSGNWNRSSTGTFTASAPRDRAVYLRGGNTSITANGGETYPFLRIEKTAATNTITLNNSVTITNEVSFTTGVVVSTSAIPFIMADNATYTGGSGNSFVDGYLRKVGNDAFTFPVGDRVGTTNHYRTIGISAPGNTGDAFGAEFVVANARLLGTVQSPLVRVSKCEYWNLNRTNGVSNVSVTLSWTPQSNCNVSYVTNGSQLVVARNAASFWYSEGQSASPLPPLTSGTVTSAGLVSSFGPFALGSTDQGSNPLPFTLLSFNGRNRTKDIELNFSVKGNDEQQHYLVERSADGRNFSTLIKIAAISNTSIADYTTLDEQPVNGWNYYRVTAVDYNDRSTQSQIIRVWFGSRAGNPSIYPNPVQGGNVQLFTGGMPKGMYNVQVMGVDGKIILSRNWQFDGVQPLYNLSVPQLPAGMYYLVLRGENQPPVQLKFVK